MVTAIRLYIEGDSELRPGFIHFFGRQIKQAGEMGIRFEVRLTGSTEKTLGAFLIANHENPDDLNVCLIDSDRSEDGTLWQELLQHKAQHPRWRRLRKPDREQAHWMIQAMEAWFLADREALRRHFGSRLRERQIPNSNAEEVSNPKRVLRRASASRPERRYHETRDAPELLRRLNIEKVRQAAPACERLLRTLEGQFA